MIRTLEVIQLRRYIKVRGRGNTPPAFSPYTTRTTSLVVSKDQGMC
jgi:hypothetical protein